MRSMMCNREQSLMSTDGVPQAPAVLPQMLCREGAIFIFLYPAWSDFPHAAYALQGGLDFLTEPSR